MLRLPLRIGHPVNRRASLVLRHAAGFRQPIAKAVATEARQPHQVDILNIGPMLQMVDQPAESLGRYGIVNLIFAHRVSPG